MRTFTFGMALLGVLALSGCPKGGGEPTVEYDEEALATNPAANFHKGMSVVNNPDRKTGEVDYAQAYSYFAKSSDLGGGAKAAFNAGWIAERIGRIDDAVTHYQKAFDEDPSYDAAAFSLARVLTSLNKHVEAAEIYRVKSEASPNDLSAKNEYMAALVRAGDFETAISQAQAVLRRDPKNAETYRNLSALYYAQDNYSMSQLTAEKALELDDSDPGVYNNMGVTYLIQNNEPSAIDKFKTAIKLNSTHYESNMNLGYTALNSGDYALALTAFEAATTANPSSLDARLGLAVSKRGTGEFKEAEKLYDEIIDADPEGEAAYYNAAVLNLYYTRDFDKAEKYLQAYINSHNVGPTHEVYARMQAIQDAKDAEAERKRIEAERIAAEKERERKNKELLGEIGVRAEALMVKVEEFAVCLDEASVEEVLMVVEQALMVVEMGDADMAGDIDQFLEAYEVGVDNATEGCNPADWIEEEPVEEAPAEEAPAEEAPAEGAEEAPAEGADEAPAEGADEAPAEEAAAEEAPAEEAPAEEAPAEGGE